MPTTISNRGSLSRFARGESWKAALAAALLLLSACGGGDGITVTTQIGGLRFISQPASVTVGQPFSVTVELTGSDGARASGATNTVTLSLSGATLTGTISVAAVAGVATFSGLTIATPATGLQLTASAGGRSAASNTFASVDPNVAASLRFVTQPQSVNVGQAFSIAVEILNTAGQRATNEAGTITLSAGSATISGTTSVNAVAGLATFTGLSFASAGSNIQLTATRGTLTVTSSAFSVTDPCAPPTSAIAFPGTTNGSLATGGCTVNNGQPAAFYRFAASGTGATVFTVNASYSASVAVLTDPPGSEVLQFAGAPPVTGTWLLPARTYQVRVAATAGGTGAFTLTGSSPVISGCTGFAILPFASVTYSSSVANTNCQETGGFYYRQFYVFSNSPCTITMRSTAFDAFLLVRDSNGNEIASDDDSGGGNDARISLGSCSSGGSFIEIQASTFFANTFGNFTLNVAVTGGVAVAPPE